MIIRFRSTSGPGTTKRRVGPNFSGKRSSGRSLQDAQRQSGPQELFLQRHLSPQRQAGLHAQPTVLDVLAREGEVLLIFISMGLGVLRGP
jgi:hypothetical protein